MNVQVIGVARTPFAHREDAPHQPSAAPDAAGTIEIAAPFREALHDLDGFDRVWVLFWFDRNQGWRARVKPPRGGPKRGVFATRAPHRPTPIGLTCVALESVDIARGVLAVRGLDLLDGTPVVDLKPYFRRIDAWPDAKEGWLAPYLAAGVEPKLKRPRGRRGNTKGR